VGKLRSIGLIDIIGTIEGVTTRHAWLADMKAKAKSMRIQLSATMWWSAAAATPRPFDAAVRDFPRSCGQKAPRAPHAAGCSNICASRSGHPESAASQRPCTTWPDGYQPRLSLGEGVDKSVRRTGRPEGDAKLVADPASDLFRRSLTETARR
jgi:hypothetical protein